MLLAALRLAPGATATVLAVGGLALWGCGAPPMPGAGSTAAFSGAALMTLSTPDNALRIEVRTAPQPPERGMNAAELRASSAAGEPVDGLELTVVPWMPDMGHGTSLTPVVTAPGGGEYRVDNLSLFMAGRWQLRTSIAGTATGSVVPEFEIQ
jgi:hypothetical protein